jgi:hypothetical protein
MTGDAATTEQAGSRLGSLPSSHLVRFATLSGAWAFSVSQPVFSFVVGNPEFLVMRDASRSQAIGFAVLLAFGPPLAAVAYAALAGLVSRWVGGILFLALLGGFLVPLGLQLVKSFDPGRALAFLLPLAFCSLAVLAYVRWRGVRLFLAFSVVLPIAGLAWYVHGIPLTSDAEAAAPVTVRADTPVVVVVLDELPLSSLLRRNGAINAARYPNFARLAGGSTWYPNATTVDGFTGKAVPAILTGRIAPQDTLPTTRDHPRNLFTLLGESYSMFVHDATSRLCPEPYCSRGRDSFLEGVGLLFEDIRPPYILKVVPDAITGAGPSAIALDLALARASDSAVDDFDQFLDDFSQRTGPRSLHFAHVLLPHFPWRYLPSGQEYIPPVHDGPGRGRVWPDDRWLAQQGLQRHLVQLRYTDLLMGRFLRTLEKAGVYDRALVVVVADHGVAFEPAVNFRGLSEERFADVASVPLFVKYPGQRRGAVDRRAARTVDVLPTIADVVGARVPWRIDGVSLLGRPKGLAPAAAGKSGTFVRVPMAELERQNEALVERNAEMFGDGRDSLFDIGEHRDLLNQPVEPSWRVEGRTRVRLEEQSALANVDPSSAFVPAYLAGVVEDDRIEADTELAIAVNGRIRALTRAYDEGGQQRFGALVRPSAFRDGFNLVEVFAIEERSGRTSLVRLGGNGR